MIQRTHKQSDLEKRLKFLEMQLHGKKSENSESQKLKLPETLKHRASDTPGHSESFRTDVVYLRADLTKIFILSTIAIAAEFLLFFGSRYGFLRLF